MPSSFEIVILLITIIWLSILTFLFTKLFFHYNKLTKGTNNKNLISILENLLKNVDDTKKDIDLLKNRCDTIEEKDVFHFQKFGLVRFNPFKDTGGDQSFIMALLDGNDNGIVISSLYSRSGARWYAKRVISGKGMEYELSEEEKKVIKDANTKLLKEK